MTNAESPMPKLMGCLFLSNRFREHVLEGRHARAEMPDLHAELRGELENRRVGIFTRRAGQAGGRGRDGVRHEHAHDVFVCAVNIHARLAQVLDESYEICLLYTSDAADDLLCVDLGGRRIIKKKNN